MLYSFFINDGQASNHQWQLISQLKPKNRKMKLNGTIRSINLIFIDKPM